MQEQAAKSALWYRCRILCGSSRLHSYLSRGSDDRRWLRSGRTFCNACIW